MKRRTYALVFVFLTIGILAFEFYLTLPFYGPTSCPRLGTMPRLSPSGFDYTVGPPLFTFPQFVMRPGTTARFTVTYTAYDGNNFTGLTQRDFPDYSSLIEVGHFDQISYFVSTNTTGLTVVSSVKILPKEAVQNVTVIASPNAAQTTYDLGIGVCQVGALLTVGYLPYWESVFYSVQLATVIGSVLIAGAVTLLLSLAMRVSGSRRGSPETPMASKSTQASEAVFS